MLRELRKVTGLTDHYLEVPGEDNKGIEAEGTYRIQKYHWSDHRGTPPSVQPHHHHWPQHPKQIHLSSLFGQPASTRPKTEVILRMEAPQAPLMTNVQEHLRDPLRIAREAHGPAVATLPKVKL